MVLGVRLEVLGELPDARRRERDLDLGRARVLVSSPVLGDHFALDFSLFCQTEEELYRLFDDRLFHTISTLPSERGSAPNYEREPARFPLIGALNGRQSTLSSPVINSAGFAPLLNPPGMGSIELVLLATNGRRQNKVAAG